MTTTITINGQSRIVTIPEATDRSRCRVVVPSLWVRAKRFYNAERIRAWRDRQCARVERRNRRAARDVFGVVAPIPVE